MEIKTLEHRIDIYGTEVFNYNMNPGYLTFNTNEFVIPELAFSGLEIIDVGKNTYGNPIDGRIQKGEQVFLKIYIQNIAQNIAPNVKFEIKSADPNLMLKDTNGQVCNVFSGELGNMDRGDVASFKVAVSPNQLVKEDGNLPLFLTVTNDYHRGNLVEFPVPLALDQKPAEIVKVDVEANYEKLAKPFARFELPPENFTGRDPALIDIGVVPGSMTTHPDAIGIVIGVEHYDNFAPAPYAVNDANIMEKYLKNVLGLGFVRKYTDKEVTGNFFDNQFNPYYGKIKNLIVRNKTDVFVFYSGHGLPSKDGKKSYLIPSDCNKLAFEKQGYELGKLYDNLDSLGARSVTIFLDACFSGDSRITESLQAVNLASTKGVYVRPPESQPWLTNPNFTVFSSSTFDQTSIGFDEMGYGLFTYYLCAGIQGNADENADGKISMNELTAYVINNVSEKSRRTLGLQTPVFHGTSNMLLVEFDK